jgi:hypothetical protein
MSSNFNNRKILRRLGFWTIPVVSVTSFVPLLFFQLIPFNSQNVKAEKVTPLPPLSQLPPPSQNWEAPLAKEEPLMKSPSLLKAPQPIQPEKTQSKPSTTGNKQVSTPKKVENYAKKALERKNNPKKPQQTPQVNRQVYNPIISPPQPQYNSPKLEIKVAILRDGSSTTIGSSQAASLLDTNGRILQSLPPNESLLVQPTGSSLSVGNWQLPQVVWLQPSPGGFIYLGDRWYRGKLLLVSQGSSLLAVNYVDLEEYLYSVVGSEMHPNAPLEALKAQAIAARSYALVHMIRPASQWYHLGATERWQAYKGINREFNTTHQAVNTTAGQILSYKGGVVESLYAATDQIVATVHKGRGMSQIGAYDLAKQGYDYQQILGNYYPGVGLARLVLR